MGWDKRGGFTAYRDWAQESYLVHRWAFSILGTINQDTVTAKRTKSLTAEWKNIDIKILAAIK